ncbi:Vms1/Ankzf1 family peptidyl-tRNA hydrolase [Kineococcus rhizosphaerae]|uniref:Peptide subunit release factor 1 (ERF1) n=1 Tax=Kineococcus rhizosphaerae TaxID=559628 RepID=A0A2T0QYF9_9ACTN|nr:Vms1/Ankzf1 family peptidyl-tRNA hydrolase [Kineococcus rhizosphaerae]PRY11398.1 peptide subunit release factor 1 (eRF1) [Kineococcus rhizosphaerae]
MKLDWLKDVALDPGPHVTVYTDATRDRETGAHDIDLRWHEARTALAGQGAPEPALVALDAVATEPTGVGGHVGRAMIATATGLELDVVLPAPPPQEEATTGPVAHLMPLVRSTADDVRYVLVELDRAGADITVTSSGALRAADVHSVEGGHDLLHKGSGDNRAEHRYQHAVQDSWDHNAAAVADDVADLVRREHPDVVLVTGDAKAVAAFKDKAPVALTQLLCEVKGGGRAAGTRERAFTANVAHALDEVRTRRRQAVVDRFVQERGRQGRAVEGLGPVVAALRAGQVATLLLLDDPTATGHLWAGTGPLELATTTTDLHAIGVRDVEEVRTDAALVRALAASDAEIELVPRPEEDGQEPLLAMADGIGALLRYTT